MQNNDEALLSISLASHGQFVKMLITLEPHGIFSLNFAFLYILKLSSVYQIKLNNYRQQELCRSKQSYFFYKSQVTLQSNINFYMGQSYKQVSISRDKMQSSKKKSQTTLVT